MAIAGDVPESFAPLVEKLSPAVVNISTSQKVKGGALVMPFPGIPEGQQEEFKDFFERFGLPKGGDQPVEREVRSLGSGFVIDPSGYVVTNNHVVEQAEQISVRFQDDTKYEAKVVGRDPKTDLALLKIEAGKPLPYVSFGDSDGVKVGDWILAIGNPYGLGGTVTAGIISARSRNINAGPFDDFLQTDAAINRGNSGGPMFNTKGEVIGVNSAIFSPTGGSVGIGFAIPSALAEPVLKQLKEFGKTHRGWLGVKIQHVTDEIADSVGLKEAKGALVLEVTKDSPASEAGIKAGDIVLEYDGKPVKEMRNLPRLVAETKTGTRVTLVIWRDEHEQALTAKIAELNESEEEQAAGTESDVPEGLQEKGEPVLGMMLSRLDAGSRSHFEIDETVKGVVIVGVNRESDAAKQGIHPGDVIVSVNQGDVNSVSDVKSALKDAKSDGKKFVLIRIWRGGDYAYITLPVDEK